MQHQPHHRTRAPSSHHRLALNVDNTMWSSSQDRDEEKKKKERNVHRSGHHNNNNNNVPSSTRPITALPTQSRAQFESGPRAEERYVLTGDRKLNAARACGLGIPALEWRGRKRKSAGWEKEWDEKRVLVNSHHQPDGFCALLPQ